MMATAKQTSPEISALAAKYLAMSDETFFDLVGEGETGNVNVDGAQAVFRDLQKLAASRWLAIARTGFEQAFMALNRAVFQPGRVALPGDDLPAAAKVVDA